MVIGLLLEFSTKWCLILHSKDALIVITLLLFLDKVLLCDETLHFGSPCRADVKLEHILNEGKRYTFNELQ